MQIKQVADQVWIIEGERIWAPTKEEAVKKYWIVRSQT